MKLPRIVTARPPKRRPEPERPKPKPAAAVLHRPRSKRAVKDVEVTFKEDAAAKAFLKRMIQPNQ